MRSMSGRGRPWSRNCAGSSRRCRNPKSPANGSRSRKRFARSRRKPPAARGSIRLRPPAPPARRPPFRPAAAARRPPKPRRAARRRRGRKPPAGPASALGRAADAGRRRAAGAAEAPLPPPGAAAAARCAAAVRPRCARRRLTAGRPAARRAATAARSVRRARILARFRSAHGAAGRAGGFQPRAARPSRPRRCSARWIRSATPRGRTPRDPDEDEEPQERRKPRSMGGLIKVAIAVVLVLGLGYVAYSQRGLVTSLFQSRADARSRATASPAHRPRTSRDGRRSPTGSARGQQAGPAVAQRVVLYEEEPNDPQGKRYIGSAIWRTETVSPGPGRPPELAIRADVEIPERRMTMTFSIRRNTDQTLPASHTIEVMFNLPADFPPGGIQNVPGVLMKQAEQTRGTPLAGLAVKVTNNFFLIGLSAVESDQQRNIQLLKERAWFDIPIVYNNNRRAILAIEKGTPGERAFAEAFAAWKQ